MSLPEIPVTPARRLILRLYVAGNSVRSGEAIANLTSVCLEYDDIAPEIEIVDILEDPIRALSDGVLVTPLLVRLAPTPVVRVVGNLSSKPALLLALGVSQKPC